MATLQCFLLLQLVVRLQVTAFPDSQSDDDLVWKTDSFSDSSPYFTPEEDLPARPTQDEARLLAYLMKNYNREVRPVINASSSVVVDVGITLTQIFDMDEKNQVMTTNVWLDQEWTDELLTWNPHDFGNISRIRIPCDKIWLPDIVLYNNADDYSGQYMRSLALINYTGRVFWPPPTKFRSTCPVDVAFFPFDDQICMLRLGSWIYDGFAVDVLNRSSIADLTNYLPNGEWTLMETPELVRIVKYFPCCPDVPFPQIFITLHIRRKTLYYMYNIVFPCMMMSTLTVLVFCLPPDSGEKIALGVTVLLAFSVFMLAIAEKMPETSESIPLIGIYLTSVMAITCVSVIMTVIVLNFFYRGPTLTDVPVWIQRHILKKNASCIRQRGHVMANHEVPLRRPSIVPPGNMGHTVQRSLSALSEKCSVNIIKRAIKRRQNCTHCSLDPTSSNRIISRSCHASPKKESITEEHNTLCGIGINNGSPGEMMPVVMESRDKNSSSCPIEIRVVPPSSPGSADSPRMETPSLLDMPHMDGICSELEELPDSADVELSKLLELMTAKQREDDLVNETLRDWKLLAQKVDYILFWIFLALTTITSFVFIFILPYHNRGKLL